MYSSPGGSVFQHLFPTRWRSISTLSHPTGSAVFHHLCPPGGAIFARTFRVVLLGLLQVGLQELGEGSLLCEQLLVAAALRYLSVLQHDDLIHLGQERNSVGHKDASLKC